MCLLASLVDCKSKFVVYSNNWIVGCMLFSQRNTVCIVWHFTSRVFSINKKKHIIRQLILNHNSSIKFNLFENTKLSTNWMRYLLVHQKTNPKTEINHFEYFYSYRKIIKKYKTVSNFQPFGDRNSKLFPFHIFCILFISENSFKQIKYTFLAKNFNFFVLNIRNTNRCVWRKWSRFDFGTK